MNFRHTCSHLHCGVVQFLLGISPASRVTPFCAWRFGGRKSTKWPTAILNFLHNRIIVCVFMEAFPLQAVIQSEQQSTKTRGTESRSHAGSSLEAIVSGTTSMLTTWFLDSWILAIEKQYCVLETGSVNIQLFGEPCQALLVMPSRWCNNCFKRWFHCSSKLFLSGWLGKCKVSEF